MSTPEQPVQGFEARSSHVLVEASEILATLNRVEFQVFRDGEVSTDRAWRDLCFGLFGSALIGLIGLFSTIDWDQAFHLARKGPFIWTVILFGIVFGSAVGAIICHLRYQRMRTNSAYSGLMIRMEKHFGLEDEKPPWMGRFRKRVATREDSV